MHDAKAKSSLLMSPGRLGGWERWGGGTCANKRDVTGNEEKNPTTTEWEEGVSD